LRSWKIVRTVTELLFNRDGRRLGQVASAAPTCRGLPKRQGYPRAATSHTLRHTYASLMVTDSVPLMVIARNLGHADTRMVEKHYGHLATSYVRKAIRAAKPLEIGVPAKVVPLGGAR
jgi:integrase